ncbi:hypothetical protein ABPG72_009322 [Tetrahymena utriculariae]
MYYPNDYQNGEYVEYLSNFENEQEESPHGSFQSIHIIRGQLYDTAPEQEEQVTKFEQQLEKINTQTKSVFIEELNKEKYVIICDIFANYIIKDFLKEGGDGNFKGSSRIYIFYKVDRSQRYFTRYQGISFTRVQMHSRLVYKIIRFYKVY